MIIVVANKPTKFQRGVVEISYAKKRYLNVMHYQRQLGILFLTISWLAILLSGCNNKTDAQMSQIEATLDNALDSATILPAIRILDSIPTENLSKRQQAIHNLLTIQSRHKQHHSLASDSLIFSNATSFENSSDTRHQMKWHFYRGATRLELQDYRGAIYDALHAVRLSSAIADTLFMAKSEELLADIYSTT